MPTAIGEGWGDDSSRLHSQPFGISPQKCVHLMWRPGHDAWSMNASSPNSSVLGISHDCIPDDHFRQMTADMMAADGLKRLSSATAAPVILDLGCGVGNSVDFFRHLAPEARWI